MVYLTPIKNLSGVQGNPNWMPGYFQTNGMSIKLHTLKSRWFIVFRSKVMFSNKNIVFLSLKIDFVLANRADPGEMPRKG